jgi:hypothetical protein
MPMHDWTRVDVGVWHDFHGLWLYAIRHALNHGVLPPGYRAMSEQILRPFEPDVLAFRHSAPEDGPGVYAGNVLTLATSPPNVATMSKAKPKRKPRTTRRLVVRQIRGNRVVAVVELVSPGNRDNRRDYRAFVDKATAIIDSKIHFHFVDAFPPPSWERNGFHASIWRAVTNKRYERPEEQPLVAASYAVDDEVTACVAPFAVGHTIPSVPLFLDDGAYVMMPFEDSYQSAFSEVLPEHVALLTATEDSKVTLS